MLITAILLVLISMITKSDQVEAAQLDWNAVQTVSETKVITLFPEADTIVTDPQDWSRLVWEHKVAFTHYDNPAEGSFYSRVQAQAVCSNGICELDVDTKGIEISGQRFIPSSNGEYVWWIAGFHIFDGNGLWVSTIFSYDLAHPVEVDSITIDTNNAIPTVHFPANDGVYFQVFVGSPDQNYDPPIYHEWIRNSPELC